MMPTRRSAVDPTLGDAIQQALRDGLDVRLTTNDEGTLLVEVDGVEVAPIPWESFEYPVSKMDLDGEARALADRMLAERRRRRFRRRMRTLQTETHLAAEGGDLPAEGADS